MDLYIFPGTTHGFWCDAASSLGSTTTRAAARPTHVGSTSSWFVHGVGGGVRQSPELPNSRSAHVRTQPENLPGWLLFLVKCLVLVLVFSV